MAAATDIVLAAARHGFTLTRDFAAPRPLVFKAWTEPERAALWWRPRDFATLDCAMDVRVGGAWRIRMRSPQGTLHCKRGIYREIIAPERLVFTYAWEDAAGQPGHETMVTVGFAEHGAGTRLTLHQAIFATATAREAHECGWTSCLGGFADYLAGTA
jgi:uncharacterized protein YndB with AHSA1/START domain